MTDDSDMPPILGQGQLERLQAGLDDDEAIWKVFVQNFIEALPRRIEKIRNTLTTGDTDGAMDAVLSLRTSSQMVGAERLAGLALNLERALRETENADPAAALPLLAAAHLREIKQCADKTTHQLQALLRG